MQKRLLYVTHFDRARLGEVLEDARRLGSVGAEVLRELEEDLHHGLLVDSRAVPANVVTMNSKAWLKDLETEEEVVFELVFPADADPGLNRVSVLSALGIALFGYQVGDVIEWKQPSGRVRTFEILEILYQPEAAGDFHR